MTTLAEQADAHQVDGWSYRALRVLLVLAIAYEASNVQDAAQSTIDQALRIAAHAGYTRVFVAEGQPMARLLYRYLEKASGAADEYRDERAVAHAARVLAAFPDATSPPLSQAGSSTTSVETNAQLIEPLTPRETEVLQLIAQGLTNQEIADQLFISYETVKVHARNIYGKLDVHSRTEAVAQAQRLGVLSL
jgi:LuxR family maltose regulon positive regulatory protein